MTRDFAIVDLFAGPGGLAEGFSSFRDIRGRFPFHVALSIEKERSAHATLLLRSFLRKFPGRFPTEYYDFLHGRSPEPDWSALFRTQWRAATEDALHMELGADGTGALLDAKLDALREQHAGDVILIGGPPCQAYSLAGRARNRGVVGYTASEDTRHFLYREYVRIVERLRPAAFVMENVKGMLSSSVDGERIFDRVLDDLSNIGSGGEHYRLVALRPAEDAPAQFDGVHPPAADFIVCAEDLGLPQARHRVIVVGIRADLLPRTTSGFLAEGLLSACPRKATVRHVLDGMPRLRCGTSRPRDSQDNWHAAVSDAVDTVAATIPLLPEEHVRAFRTRVGDVRAALRRGNMAFPRAATAPVGIGADCPARLREWILDPRLEAVPNNETRCHMPSDLARYLYTALFGEIAGVSPKARDFPEALAPDHQSWTTGKFADRFRVQLWDAPSTTVTSHMSKDGHYFIHPDPLQCRSLTVREAARLQTFPDNYLFKGNRTEQYVQVGNAVPPFLARQIAGALYSLIVAPSVPDRAGSRASRRRTAEPTDAGGVIAATEG